MLIQYLYIELFKILGKKMTSLTTTSGKIKIKIVLLGNQSVGKSCIIQRYVKDVFDQTSNPTVGIDFLVKNVTHQAKSYRLQLWDTAGQQRFRSLIPNYLKDAKCALIIIDVTNRASLNSAESWLKMYNDNRTGEGFTFLIGNKIDLQYRQVQQGEAQKMAKQLGLPYYQISAKTGQNVEQLFNKLIEVTEHKSLSGVTFDLSKKQNVIKEEEENVKEQESEIKNVKIKKTQAQVPVVTPNNGEAASTTTEVSTNQKGNVVLKNEKIEKKKGENKNCC